ncbi:MAG TPA: prolyl aminopeptidase [Steroidobacteraceae bacterium]|nr:prolyl aminopeptidase [Steroidobacteraceae bacterium]
MRDLYPEMQPYARGELPVAGGDLLYWEVCGNSAGKPAVVLHGGPGSGCTPWHRRLFDPTRYRIVLFDQRGCGRSRPHASSPDTELSGNTTDNLIADIEQLRSHLQIQQWLVLGGSWGSALALAYAQHHPQSVTELVLFGVVTGRREEFDWLFREGLGALFPHAWEQRRNALPESERDGDVVEAYCRLLNDPHPDVRQRAALAWCTWESATPEWPPSSTLAPRFEDPAFALAFARLVTHYVRHDAWLGDGRVLRNVDRIADIPGVLIGGRFDFQAPIGTAWQLHRRWPRSTMVTLNEAGHTPTRSMSQEIVRATDAFAAP